MVNVEVMVSIGESNRTENKQYTEDGSLVYLKVVNYREGGDGYDVDVADS
jgi:hypothetical protein